MDFYIIRFNKQFIVQYCRCGKHIKDQNTMSVYRKLEGKSTQLLEKIRQNLEQLNEKIDLQRMRIYDNSVRVKGYCCKFSFRFSK